MSRLLTFFSIVVIALGSASGAHAADTTPPVASFADPLTLTGPATITFDEDVHDVSASNVVLRLSGSSGSYSVGLACLDAGGASADCTTGNVRTVTVTHQVVFTPGQRYDLVVNPSGATPVVDTSGNAAATTTEEFSGSPTEQESSLAATYVWKTVTATPALDGSYRTERVAGAVASFSFTGLGVSWYTVTGPDQGWAVVGIDGQKVATVNNYSATTKYQVIRRYLGLARSTHTITIRVMGAPGISGGASWVSVDAFKTSTTNFDGVETWPLVTHVPALRGAYARTATPGARVAFTFRARGIDWYTLTGPDQGTANVYLDNKLKATIRNTGASTRYGVRRSFLGLTDAIHTLTIVVAGTRGWVSVDAWSLKAPITEFARLGTWIDLFDFNASTDPSAMLDGMQSHGVRTLYIETARYNSVSSFGTDTTDETAAIGRWLDGAHARGIKVVGWYFPAYSEYLDTDVARTVAIAKFRSPGQQAFDGLAIDIEYKGKTSSLTEFNNGITTHLARVRLQVGSLYPIAAITPSPVGMSLHPSSWTGFPWAAIGASSDVVMPMAYWSYRRESTSQCSASVDTYCAYKYTVANIQQAHSLTKLPVHDIGGLEQYTLNGSTYTIPDSDVSDFVRAAREDRAYGASFYDYRTTRSAWWATLAGLNGL